MIEICFIIITDLKKQKLLNGPTCEVKAALLKKAVTVTWGRRCHFTMGDIEEVVSVSV